MAYSRYKYFKDVKSMQWGKPALEKAFLQHGRDPKNECLFSLVKNEVNNWEINIPLLNTKDDSIEFQTLDGYSQFSENWDGVYDGTGFFKIAGTYPFKTFRDAFMAAKELQEIYAKLPISVVEVSGQNGVIIGSSNADEIGAVLTYS
jgi:hypothetical protein